MGASDTNSNALQIRYASHSFNQWLGPIKQAHSFEWAFLVSATPKSSRQVANTGWVQAWAPVDEETVARK